MGKENRLPEFLEAYDETGEYDGPASYDELDSELYEKPGSEEEDHVGNGLNSCDEFEPRGGSFAVLVGEGDPVCENCVNWAGQYCNIAGLAGHGGRCHG